MFSDSKVTNLRELIETENGPYKIELSDGTSHEVDLVVPAVGVEVNPMAFQDGLGEF